MNLLKSVLTLFKDSIGDFFKDRATIYAAGLAYYTVFSLVPLLVFVTAIAGLFIGRSAAGDQIAQGLQYIVGPELAGFLDGLIQTLTDRTASATATVISLVALIIGAGGIFNQLKIALNLIWGITNVRPKNTAEWFLLARYRAVPFLMVFAFGLLLGVTVLVDTILGAVSNRLEILFPELGALLPQVSLLIVPALTFITFLLIFKLMPDAYSRWRDVAVGALVSMVLFSVGRQLLTIALTLVDTNSLYGAAGSFVVLLIWVYFSAQILLFGAEFTWLYALRFGKPIRPNRMAEFVMMTAQEANE